MFKTAAKIVKNGGVIAYPTEAVWGLGCDPFNLNAVNKLLALKKRSPNKGLILIAANLTPVLHVLDYLTDNEKHIITNALHTTFLLKHNNKISNLISGGRDNFALRITKHAPAIKLCTMCGGLLVSTSANLDGMNPATTKEQVVNYFANKLDFILDADIGNYQKPSTIIDFTNNKIIRA